MTELIHYDAAMRELAVAHEVDEVAELRNKAAALESYARQAKNTDMERKACEIRLRAERKVGALLVPKGRTPVENRNPSTRVSDHDEPIPSDYQQAKKQAGISDTQAKRWQSLAKVPEQEFESAMRDPDTKPTTAGLIKKRNESESKMHPHALWLWGRLRDFERDELIPPADILGELTETMSADVRRIAPIMADYLHQIEDLLND